MCTSRPLNGVIVWILIVAISGCTTVKPTSRYKALSSWIDYHYYEALFELGRPLEVFSDNIGRVLVYESVNQVPPPRIIVPEDSLASFDYVVWDHALSRDVPTNYARTYDLLYIDKDGRIYSIQSNESSREMRVNYENGLIVGGIVTGIALLVLLVVSYSQEESSY